MEKNKLNGDKTIIIDAENAIAGRLASYVAKQLLLGNEVKIVNADKSVITGSKDNIGKKYLRLRQAGGRAQKGPLYPSNPERILKRMIRGMLPHKKGRGRDAFKKIRCYNGIPPEYEKEKMIRSSVRKTRAKTITIKELSKKLKN